jgi:hypothetical protein
MTILRFGAPGSLAALAMLSSACTTGTPPDMRRDGGRPSPIIDGGFVCLEEESEACLNGIHYSCESDGEFLRPVREVCADFDPPRICDPVLFCVVCSPGTGGCNADGDAVVCREDGSGWDVVDDCDNANGEVCDLGMCINLCDQALRDRSYLGCEFYAADLDNAAIGAGRDASSQPYAIVVSNPGNYPTDVIVEHDTGVFGGETVPVVVARQRVLPGDLEVFQLPRREVDGSSSFDPCGNDAECGSATQQCYCQGGTRPDALGATDCRCRSSASADGMNDGTHSALTAHGYRVRAGLPIIAYQFNPLDNVGVFSNDASLLLPTSGIGPRYTVIGWPQTIAHSEDPSEDFDPRTDDEDLRAFLTIVGTQQDTHLTVTLGPKVRQVVGVDAWPAGVPGDVWEFDLGMFDVVNLETQGFNGDFTGTQIVATNPVTVFTGSEASDAPRFDDIANRQCCADHLEEQLFPDDALGSRFVIGRNPARTAALNQAFITGDSVGMFNEPEYVRVLAIEDGLTLITTTLPPPHDSFELGQGEDIILTATQDLMIDASQAVSVLQTTASQETLGIPSDYPGGDPDIIVVPPMEQWRQDYVFLTPDFYAFDFVTIVAPIDAAILLDERPIAEWACDVGDGDGRVRRMGDPPPTHLVYRCQFSFPDVTGRPSVRVDDGAQNDGYHTVRTSHPEGVGVIISGFDAYVSYAYVAGANLESIR